jgi:two-component system sensor histidine kinase RegB
MTQGKNPAPQESNSSNLRLLAAIRCILVAGQGSALAISYYYLELELNYPVLLGSMMVLFGLAVSIFLKSTEASTAEYFAHLVADIVILTVVLYFTGGSTNPFVSYYLVPLTISAAILPWGYTWSLACMSLLLYTLLLFIYQPLDIFSANGMHDSSAMSPHIVGMWINFVVSALLITYFVVKMARQLRIRDEELHRVHEDRIRDEQIMSLATMAAGTAHELGTPLSTVSVLLHEMRDELGNNSESVKMIDLMRDQVDRCKNTLQDMVDAAERNAEGETDPIAIFDYVTAILDSWRVMRPATTVTVVTHSDEPVPDIATDSTLTQAIINLLNNAADASPSIISVESRWSDDLIRIVIRDRGAGIDPGIIDELGKPFITTKSSGLGVGLFLADAAIRRRGGNLYFENQPEGGAMATVALPRLPNR